MSQIATIHHAAALVAQELRDTMPAFVRPSYTFVPFAWVDGAYEAKLCTQWRGKEYQSLAVVFPDMITDDEVAGALRRAAVRLRTAVLHHTVDRAWTSLEHRAAHA